jgi:hypothetical protein
MGYCSFSGYRVVMRGATHAGETGSESIYHSVDCKQMFNLTMLLCQLVIQLLAAYTVNLDLRPIHARTNERTIHSTQLTFW